jgi:hypothetical protein
MPSLLTLLEKRFLQLFKNPQGLLSGHIFATLRGSSAVFSGLKPLKVLVNLKNH